MAWPAGQADRRRSFLKAGLADLRDGLAMRDLWLFLGWQDIQKQYRRSVLGPLWLTLSMGAMILGMGVVYSQVFAIGIASYLPFLTAGMLAWSLISSLLVGGCSVFLGAAQTIRQVRMPLSVHILRAAWTQFLTFLHMLAVFALVAVMFGVVPGLRVLLVVPAVLLVLLNGVFAAMILGPLCARFRDVPMIVGNVLQIAFFITPIAWSAGQLPGGSLVASLNPFHHFVEIVRGPLLGGTAEWHSWLVCLAVTGLTGIAGLVLFSRLRARIPYWV